MTGKATFALVWDPEAVGEEDYVKLVTAIADLVRASSGFTIERLADPVPEGAPRYPVLSPETEALIQQGIDSGPGVVADEAFWEERRKRREQRRAAQLKEG
jgi:hypothetical protein